MVYVKEMFNDIAFTYDRLNHLLSLGIDRIWRRRAIALLVRKIRRQGKIVSSVTLLDVATGTGDMAFEAALQGFRHIIAVDIAEKMLEQARIKQQKKNMQGISFVVADAGNLPFEANFFDAAMVAFGIRNFADINAGLRKIAQVLKPAAPFVVIEFSTVRSPLLRALYNVYFNGILPIIGRIISGHTYAYEYLPYSVSKFPSGKEFIACLQANGFSNASDIPLWGGIATIYVAERADL